MRWSPSRTIARIARAVCALLPLACAAASAQDVTEPALKAAFIYNFAKFTDWPPGVMLANEPLTLCVLGDSSVADALERAVVDRLLLGHKMAVTTLAISGPRRGCHVLYVSGVTVAQATQIVDGLRDLPVLTISDVEGFTKLGGIAQFFFVNGQLRFDVENGSARRAHLQISSRLLVLARHHD